MTVNGEILINFSQLKIISTSGIVLEVENCNVNINTGNASETTEGTSHANLWSLNRQL